MRASNRGLVLGLFDRARPPEDEYSADVLHSRGIGSGAQLVDQSLTRGAVTGTNPDLEQLVRGQRLVDFGDDRLGEAGVADMDIALE